MSLRSIDVQRYVTPLREGGSLPAVIEGDDEGLYVLKFRGAGQGAKALIAELVAGEIARELELPIPELVLATLDPELARTEPDPEIQELIRASSGLNLAMDYLPGSITFDPAAETPSSELASRIVWFDALVSNVDRTARNTNLLMWHRRLWLIDHGAALYFHHGWEGDEIAPDADADKPFALIKDHVLLASAQGIAEADAELTPRLDRRVLERIVAQVPDAWLQQAGHVDADTRRRAYVDYFMQRLAQRRFVDEAIHAHG